MAMSGLRAEPANVLVGNLIFTRPEGWKWEEPTKTSSALTRFVVVRPGSGLPQTDVRFYVVDKDVSTEKQTILSQFPEASAADVAIEQTKVGKQKVVYFRIFGTYQYHDTRPRPDQLWIAAAIPTKKNQFIYARMLGPSNEVEGCISTFKTMVEAAVRERDLN